MNVIDFALQIEQDGQAYYRKLAAESESKELKNLFTLLADAEESHIEALTARKTEHLYGNIDSPLLERAKNIFQRLQEMHNHGPFKVDHDGYRHAIKAEEQSIGFYEKCAAKEEALEVRHLLQALADEERIHLSIVENIYDFVLTPKCFLAWREFSNLRGL